MRPDLLILGQVTVDHVVPARPGAWREQLGGNALYAAAGARLWLDPGRVGVVSRIGRGCPVDPVPLLRAAGVRQVAIQRARCEQLVEWVLYEADGERRFLPRNVALRTGRDEGRAHAAYLEHLREQSPSLNDIPHAWLPCAAAQLAPQVAERHGETVRGLRAHTRWLGVDPSPHYSRSLDPQGLAALLDGANALLPSEHEVAHLLGDGTWEALGGRLADAGFDEVVLKRGAAGALCCAGGAAPLAIPAYPITARDATGAGDAFCGAYAACRLLGEAPPGAARRAALAAALVVACAGVEAALALAPEEAARRFMAWSAS